MPSIITKMVVQDTVYCLNALPMYIGASNTLTLFAIVIGTPNIDFTYQIEIWCIHPSTHWDHIKLTIIPPLTIKCQV